MNSGIRIKICCIKSPEEAAMAIEHGADALGLVSNMPSGPGVIGERMIRNIAAGIPPPIASFLLTSRQDVQGIINQQRYCRTNTIQICDALPPGQHELLREKLPGIKLVQVIHVTGTPSIDEAIGVAEKVDAILLDSGNPKAQTRELGGTGRKHNWDISRQIRGSVACPVFLAGGINAGNLEEAISTVHPFGLDLCSGVRTNDNLDEQKLAAFFKELNNFSC